MVFDLIKHEEKTHKIIYIVFLLYCWQQGIEGRKEMFYLTMHSTHFIYGYMVSDIWLRTIQIAKEETAAATWAILYD